MKQQVKRQKQDNYRQKNFNKGGDKPYRSNSGQGRPNKSYGRQNNGQGRPMSRQGRSQSKPRFNKENNNKTISTVPNPKANKESSLQHLPTIEQMLAIPKQDRLAKSTEIFEKVKPFLTSFLMKKQGSRVAQLLFKWGNHTIKTTIYKQIIKSWKQLIKSNYALYIIAKVSKQFQLPGLVQDLVLLQNNRQGAQILQNFIHSSPQSQTAKQLKAKIHALHQQALKPATQQFRAEQSLDNMAIRSIQKQYYHFQLSKLVLRLRLPKMFDQEKQKAIEVLSQNISSIVNDQEGVRLFIELMNNCSAKDKKAIIKQYKGYVSEIVQANNVSYVSLIKLLTETDDTVLIVKSFEEELLQIIPQILTCKKAFSIVFALFSPRNNNFNILGKYEPHVEKTECKKPEDQRKKEVRQSLYQPLMDFLKQEENLTTLLKNPVECKLIVGIQKSMQQDHYSSYHQFVKLILQHFLSIAQSTISSQENFNQCLLSDGNATKVLKSLLCIQEDFVEFYCEELAKLFLKHIKTVIESRASFVLLAILEKGGRDHLLKEIIKSGVKFDKCIAGKHFVKLIDEYEGKSGSKGKPQQKFTPNKDDKKGGYRK